MDSTIASGTSRRRRNPRRGQSGILAGTLPWPVPGEDAGDGQEHHGPLQIGGTNLSRLGNVACGKGESDALSGLVHAPGENRLPIRGAELDVHLPVVAVLAFHVPELLVPHVWVSFTLIQPMTHRLPWSPERAGSWWKERARQRAGLAGVEVDVHKPTRGSPEDDAHVQGRRRGEVVGQQLRRQAQFFPIQQAGIFVLKGMGSGHQPLSRYRRAHAPAFRPGPTTGVPMVSSSMLARPAMGWAVVVESVVLSCAGLLRRRGTHPAVFVR